MPTVLMIFVAGPWVPRAAMKAKARTMPPRLAATPENASTPLRSQRPLQADDDEGEHVPINPPSAALTADSLERLGEVAAEGSGHRLAHRRDVGVCGLFERLDEHRDRWHDEEQSEEEEERDQSGQRRRLLADAQAREPAPAGAGSTDGSTASTSTVAAIGGLGPSSQARRRRPSAPSSRPRPPGRRRSDRPREGDLLDQLGRGQVGEHVLGDHAVLDERGVAGGNRPALEIAEGAFVGEDVLDPQPRRVRVRRVGDDTWS